jgi:photosystem II stability/assembly factor-like uncharacterized protein
MKSFLSRFMLWVLLPMNFCAADGWFLQTSGTTSTLLAVDFVDHNNGIAVGLGATIIRTHDGGATWTPQYSSAQSILYGVAMLDTATAVAVGLEGLILRTVDGGLNWSGVASGLIEDLNCIAFASPTAGIIAGGSGKMLRTTDAGATWQPVTSGVTDNLYGIAFVTGTTGYAVGGFRSGIILKTTNAGFSWVQLASGTSSILTAVSGTGENVAMAVGSGGTVLRTTNSGATWEPRGTGGTSIYYGVACVDSSLVYAASCGIMKSTDGGLIWTTSPLTTCVRAICMTDGMTGTAVGQGGAILRTTTGGEFGWTRVQSNTTSFLWGVSFGSLVSGVAVGDSGTILRTTDTGETWTRTPAPTSRGLRDVSFADDAYGLAVGDSGTILATTDGGTSWQQQVSGTDVHLTSVQFFSRTLAYVGGRSAGLKTTNGGVQWISQSFMTGQWGSVNFFDPTHGIAAYDPIFGAPSLRWTTDGGATWSLWQGTYSGFRPRGIAMLNSTVAVAVGVGARRSTNGGATWIDSVGISNLYGVSFANASTGTAVGNRIYRTTDGGRSWTQQFTVLTTTLYAVDQLTPDVAVAVGLNGEIYRTLSGGIATGVPEKVTPIPTGYALEQNYPNPFNPATTIRFSLPRSGHVTLRIYDILGSLVETVLSGDLNAGSHSVRWDAGTRASGVYFYRLDAGTFVETKKLLLLR